MSSRYLQIVSEGMCACMYACMRYCWYDFWYDFNDRVCSPNEAGTRHTKIYSVEKVDLKLESHAGDLLLVRWSFCVRGLSIS